jgi:TP901 family phage tail tape measure protein
MANTQSELNFKVEADARGAIKALNNVTRELKVITREVRKTSKSTKGIENSFKSFEKTTEALTNQLKGVVAGLIAFEGAKNTVSLMADLEQGFIGVAKTTGMAGDEFNNFKRDLLKLSTKMAGVSTQELQQIAETAGQLGIKGSKNILSFTETIAKMSVATDLSAEEAAKAMAQLGNSMGEPIANYEKMASVINELSNNTTATASNIVDIAQRFGGLGKTIGLTTEQVFGLSSAMKDFGFENEVAGTALNALFGKMLTETEKFAYVSGKSLKDWSKMIKTKPVEALKVFLKEFSKLDKISKANTLKDLGLGDQGVVQAVYKMSSNIDTLNKSLTISAKEWKLNQSMQKEYEASSQAFNAQIEKTKNSLKALASKVGDKLLPVLKEGNSEFAEWINNLDEKSVNEFAKSIATTATAFVKLFEAIGGVTSSTAEGWVKILAFFSNGMEAFESKTKKFTKAILDARESTKRLQLESEGAMGGTTQQVQLVTLALKAQIAQNKANIAEFKKYDGTAPVIAEIEKENKKLSATLSKLGVETKNIDELNDANKKTIKTTKEVAKATEDATKKVIILKQSEINAIEKANQKREISYSKTIVSLEQKEERLSQKIKQINEKLQQDLQRINNDRLASIEGIENKIREIKLKGATDYQRYKDNEKQIEVKYAKAKQALTEGNLEAYRRYSAEYQSLVMENANSEIGQINKNKQANIDKLRAIEVLEEQYFNKKEQMVKADANAQKASINAQLEGVKAQLEATKALLQLVQKLNQTIADRKSFKVDSVEAEKQIKSLDEQINSIDAKLKSGSKVNIKADAKPAQKEVENFKSNIAKTSTTIEVNSDTELAKRNIESILTSIDNSTSKFIVEADTQGALAETQKALSDIRNLQTLVPISGDTAGLMSQTLQAEEKIRALQVALKVGADTTEVETKTKEVQSVIESIKAIFQVEANTTDAKKEVATVANEAQNTQSNIKVGADTTDANNGISEVENKANSTTPKVKVVADTAEANRAISELERTTYSTHIVRVKTVSENSGGGLVYSEPQRLAVGGVFRGSGKVRGYDPTDSDKVNAKLTGGEYVIKRTSAKKLGLDTLNFLNRLGKLPMPNFASGGATGKVNNSNSMIPMNIYIPNMQEPIEVMGSEDVAQRLADFISKTN